MPSGKDTKQITAEREAERKAQQAAIDAIDDSQAYTLDKLDMVMSVCQDKYGNNAVRRAMLTYLRRLPEGNTDALELAKTDWTGTIYAKGQIGLNARLYALCANDLLWIRGVDGKKTLHGYNAATGQWSSDKEVFRNLYRRANDLARQDFIANHGAIAIGLEYLHKDRLDDYWYAYDIRNDNTFGVDGGIAEASYRNLDDRQTQGVVLTNHGYFCTQHGKLVKDCACETVDPRQYLFTEASPILQISQWRNELSPDAQIFIRNFGPGLFDRLALCIKGRLRYINLLVTEGLLAKTTLFELLEMVMLARRVTADNFAKSGAEFNESMRTLTRAYLAFAEEVSEGKELSTSGLKRTAAETVTYKVKYETEEETRNNLANLWLVSNAYPAFDAGADKALSDRLWATGATTDAEAPGGAWYKRVRNNQDIADEVICHILRLTATAELANTETDDTAERVATVTANNQNPVEQAIRQALTYTGNINHIVYNEDWALAVKTAYEELHGDICPESNQKLAKRITNIWTAVRRDRDGKGGRYLNRIQLANALAEALDPVA